MSGTARLAPTGGAKYREVTFGCGFNRSNEHSKADLRAQYSSLRREFPVTLEVGSAVKIIRIPDSLLHDLPREDQEAILATLGTVTTITEIHGIYHWVSTDGGLRDFSLTEDCFEPA
jgi:hypothetical protein